MELRAQAGPRKPGCCGISLQDFSNDVSVWTPHVTAQALACDKLCQQGTLFDSSCTASRWDQC
jgi:hypothetical protein